MPRGPKGEKRLADVIGNAVTFKLRQGIQNAQGSGGNLCCGRGAHAHFSNLRSLPSLLDIR